MAGRPEPIVKGELITAVWLNQMLNYVDQRGIRAGYGLTHRDGPGGRTISLQRERSRVFDAKIIQAPPPGVPITADTCLYIAQALPPLTSEFKVGPVRPVYGVPVEAGQSLPKVLPCKVKDLCFIVVREDPAETGDLITELWVMSEKVAWGPCG